MKIVATLVVLFMLMSLTPLANEPSWVRYKLPVVETNDEGEKCLDSKQWGTVILIASEYKGLFNWRHDIEPALWKYQSLEESYELKFSILQQQIKSLEDDREYKKLRLGQEIKARTASLGAYKIEKGVMWAMIAIETITIGILGVRGSR